MRDIDSPEFFAGGNWIAFSRIRQDGTSVRVAHRLKDGYEINIHEGAELNSIFPQVAYKETVRKKVNHETKYKRQSGGSGQYGHVKITLEPNESGKGYEFVNAVVGGEIVTLQVKENSTAADKLVKNVAAGVVALKSVTENADGLVTSVKLYDGYNDGDGYVTGVGTEKAEKSTVMLKSIDQINDSNARYAWTDDVVVVRYDYKGDFNISRISSIKDDDNDGYIAVLDGDVITGICVLEKDDKGPQKPQEEKGLALNSLSFSDKGMKINFTNNSGAEFQTGAKADVVVKNSKGTQVCSIKGVQVTDGSVADKASATITFSEYTAVPSTTGEYTVTLTITAGHGTFTVTDVLGTI